MTAVTTNPAAILAQLAKVRDRAIKAGAAKVEEKLSQEGTGVKYANLPNRSSRPGEWPSKQEGDLAGSVESAPTGPLSGVISVGDKAAMFHRKPISAGGRPFLDYALHDREYLDAIDEAVKRV